MSGTSQLTVYEYISKIRSIYHCYAVARIKLNIPVNCVINKSFQIHFNSLFLAGIKINWLYSLSATIMIYSTVNVSISRVIFKTVFSF